MVTQVEEHMMSLTRLTDELHEASRRVQTLFDGEKSVLFADLDDEDPARESCASALTKLETGGCASSGCASSGSSEPEAKDLIELPEFVYTIGDDEEGEGEGEGEEKGSKDGQDGRNRRRGGKNVVGMMFRLPKPMSGKDVCSSSSSPSHVDETTIPMEREQSHLIRDELHPPPQDTVVISTAKENALMLSELRKRISRRWRDKHRQIRHTLSTKTCPSCEAEREDAM
jgi:hypothetical protein